MVCIDGRINHRYKPTTHERIFLKAEDKTYNKCLECGSPNLNKAKGDKE